MMFAYFVIPLMSVSMGGVTQDASYSYNTTNLGSLPHIVVLRRRLRSQSVNSMHRSLSLCQDPLDYMEMRRARFFDGTLSKIEYLDMGQRLFRIPPVRSFLKILLLQVYSS